MPDQNADVLLIATGCIICNLVSISWIVYQCIHFVGNIKYQQHQAFKIRGKRTFHLTAIVIILNFIFRPILVSISLMCAFSIDSNFWREIMDVVQMSLYAIIEFRCWMTYFNLNTSTALVDKQWKKYLNDKAETNNCFLNLKNIFGHPSYVGSFFALHGFLCVIVCGVTEHFLGHRPHRTLCHFFMANILIFIVFVHRMYITFARIHHTYSHDMLSINKELNLITIFMTITAICDSVLSFYIHSIVLYCTLYVLYQSILISLLSVIIFYIPQITIQHLLTVENTIKIQKSSNLPSLSHVFIDHDLYHSLIRFMLQEWSAENLLFVTQWMQIQKIIVDSGINVSVIDKYTCDKDELKGKSQLLMLPSDVLLYSNNILEASRGIYDKFVQTNDILQINIGYQPREKLNTFFEMNKNIKQIIGVDADGRASTFNLNRQTVVVVDGDNKELMAKYELFVIQLKSGEIESKIIQDMVDSFNGAVKDCWENTVDSFSRFQSTINYKFNASYFRLIKDDEKK